MICRHCRNQNPERARFCIYCGKPLPLTCRKCGTENPPEANFCLHCGQSLEDQVIPALAREENDPLLKFIPESFAAKLDEARKMRAMEGERRVVTMLFCDVNSSTNLAGQLDPEEWTEIMNQAFGFMIGPIYRYEGTVARLMGDAVLAFFGAPIAHEDDPQRAVLAGLDVLKSIQPLREDMRERYELEFNVRVGVHTGLVVVGAVGSNLRMEYTAMGDAANLAARMEQTAAPGTIQISEATRKLIDQHFETEALPALKIKGKSEAVVAHRVVGKKSEAAPLSLEIGGGPILISREEELNQLQKSVDDLRQGRGGILVLLGEAGLGKSRLIEEVRAETLNLEGRDHDLWWVQASGVPYDAAQPYGLIQQQIRRVLTEGPGKSSGAAGNPSSDARLSAPGGGRGHLSKIAGLLQVNGGAPQMYKGDQEKDSDLEGEAFQRELFDAAHAFWLTQAGRQPIVMVFDDLHWADAASVDLLLHLLDLSDVAPVLFLCAMRPYRKVAGWRLKTAGETDFPHRFHEIQLAPLDSASSQILIQEIMAEKDLPAGLLDLIMEKSEGNPFFVAEVVRALIDRGVVLKDSTSGGWRVAKDVEDILIPDSLQALLMARVDRLEPDVRRTLQLASVIGRSFYYRLLKCIVEREGDLDRHLNILQRMELVYESTRAPELEYVFRHELTRDAAYRSILRRERRRYHVRVGRALEELFSDHLEDLAPRLAYHYEQGEVIEKAVNYYRLAGDISARVYANSEAIEHYTKAVELGSSVEMKREVLLHLYTRLGRTLEITGRYEQAIKHYQALELMAEDSQDQDVELTAILAQATIFSTLTGKMDLEKGRLLGARAFELARQVEDPRAEAKALWNLMLVEGMLSGHMEQAAEYGEQALAITRKHGFEEERAYTLHDLARTYAQLGRLSVASKPMAEAATIWRKLDNKPMLADSLAWSASMRMIRGEFHQAAALGEEGLALSRTIGNPWNQSYNLVRLAPVYLELGEIGRAVLTVHDSVTIGEKASFLGGIVMGRILLAYLLARCGVAARGFSYLKSAMRMTEEAPAFLHHNVRMQAVEGLLHLYNNDLAQATRAYDVLSEMDKVQPYDVLAGPLLMMFRCEYAQKHEDYEMCLAHSEESLAEMRDQGIYFYLPDMMCYRGSALQAMGRDGALDVLEEAMHCAEAQGSRRSMLSILPVMLEAPRVREDERRTAKLQRKARQVVEFMVQDLHRASTDSGDGRSQQELDLLLELSASFSELPEVQRFMVER